MKKSRRSFIKKSLVSSTGIIGLSALSAETMSGIKEGTIRHNPIGVSTYSFWQFNGPKENTPIEYCIDRAARMGFDGIELLLVQMTSEEKSYLNKLKKLAFHSGLDLMGFSTHQGYVFPEKEKRDELMSSYKFSHFVHYLHPCLGVPGLCLTFKD